MAYNKALDLKKEDDRSWWFKGRLQAKMKRHDQAIGVRQGPGAQAGGPRAWLLQGRKPRRLGARGRGHHLLRQGHRARQPKRIRLAPQGPGPHQARADRGRDAVLPAHDRAHAGGRQGLATTWAWPVGHRAQVDAISYFQRAIDRQPKDIDSWIAERASLRDTGKTDEAVPRSTRSWEIRTRASPRPGRPSAKCSSRTRSGRAPPRLREGHHPDQMNPRAWSGKGMIQSSWATPRRFRGGSRGRWSSTKGRSGPPGTEWAWPNLKSERTGPSPTFEVKATRLNPDFREGWVRLRQRALRPGPERGGDKRAFRPGVELDPAFVKAGQNKATALMKAGLTPWRSWRSDKATELKPDYGKGLGRQVATSSVRREDGTTRCPASNKGPWP